MPSESAVHLLLVSLFEWHLRASLSGFPPQSLMHRIATEGFASRPAYASHNVLCPDMSTDLRRVQAGFNALDYELKLIVAMKHSPAPLDKNGKQLLWDDKRKAAKMGIGVRAFKNKYRRALRKIKGAPVWR